MDKDQIVWDHFKFNADQRLKGFNFFILLSIFANGGVLTAIDRRFDSNLIILLGLFTLVLAIVFWLVDSRSRNLLQLTIPALKEMEASFPEKYRLFAIDAMQQGKIVRYTFAIRVLLFCQFAFGLGVVIHGITN